MVATATDFESAYRENVSDVRAFVLRLVQDRAVADELTQEVFLKAHRAWSSFRGEVPVRIWLFRIARNTCLDHLRSPRGRNRRGTSLDEMAAAGHEPEAVRGELASREPALSIDQEVRRSEMSACVQDFVASLPETLRTALVLHDVEGLTHAEIAQVLECSLSAAKMRVSRARAQLEKLMDDNCDLFADERNVLSCLPVPEGAMSAPRFG